MREAAEEREPGPDAERHEQRRESNESPLAAGPVQECGAGARQRFCGKERDSRSQQQNPCLQHGIAFGHWTEHTNCTECNEPVRDLQDHENRQHETRRRHQTFGFTTAATVKTLSAQRNGSVVCLTGVFGLHQCAITLPRHIAHRNWNRYPAAAVAEAFSPNARIVAAKNQMSCDLAGETAILNLNNGVYYGLDPVGGRIWTLIQQPMSLGQLRDALLAEYDVDRATVEADLAALMTRLVEEGLAEIDV